MAADAFRDVSDAVPGLRALLATESSEGRAGAAHGLLMAGRPAAAMAVPDLFAAMEREPEADVRTIMARALCFLIGREAVADGIGPLVRVLGDPHPPVRAWVAEILAGPAPKAAFATDAPAACLDSDDRHLRESAQRALNNIACQCQTDGTSPRPRSGHRDDGSG